MKIRERIISPNHPPYIIAELGVNHDGSVDRALELVDSAFAAGADAIKCQYFRAEELLSRAAKLAAYQRATGAKDPVTLLKSLELDIDGLREVVDRAHEYDLHAIATVFSVELVASASTIPWDAYKTASPDVINKPLIDALLATGRPLLVSTGAASHDEVARTITWLGDHPHVLLHCVSSYPTPDDEANLAARQALARLSPHALGYSDHTASLDTGALSVASGARLLEKHFTYDRTAAGPDHAASLNPADFDTYVSLAYRAWRMLGAEQKDVHAIEREVRSVSRQSLTTRRALAKGHALASEDLTIKRPGGGIEPYRLEEVIGRTLRCDVEADVPLTEDALA